MGVFQVPKKGTNFDIILIETRDSVRQNSD